MTCGWAEIFIVVMFFVAGALSVLASAFNWDWFFDSSNAKLLTGRFSRSTARVIYLAVGFLILVMDYLIVAELLK
ncbi:MAG TPA: immunity 17 family protein [Candidatus Limisoma gallistercoris]|jgi:hypothetical protein|nr:immunity 17 family protein [Candidatus Limisoma gallistercoris]